MRTQTFVVITMISTLVTAACDAAEPTTEPPGFRITAKDVANLSANEELELELTPGVHYTFSNDDGPLAYERITLRDGERETPLEVAAAHIADHYGMTADDPRIEAFAVGVPVGEEAPTVEPAFMTPQRGPLEQKQVACYWRSPWGWECDICDWPPEG